MRVERRTGMRRVVAGAVVMASLLTACGGGGGDDDGAEPAATAAAATSGSSATTAPGATDDAPAAGSNEWIVDGRVSDAAIDGVVDGDSVDVVRVDELTDGVLALDRDDQVPLIGDLSRRVELEAAAFSGLEEALGGTAAAAEAIDAAWAAIGVDVDAAVAASAEPQGFRRSAPGAEGTAIVGLGMGWFAVSAIMTSLVGASDRREPGPPQEGAVRDGVKITSSIDSVQLEMEYTGQEKDVDVTFKARSEVKPCPDPHGVVEITTTIDVATSAAGRGQRATMDVSVTVQVGDDAEIASSEVENRIQWADFGGGAAGQFVDMTFTGSGGFGDGRVNRTGGTVTSSFVNVAATFSRLLGGMLADQLTRTAEASWKSGRCVRLDVSASPGPSGLEPGSTATIVGSPRSKIDGAFTGGTVTALLTAGGASVDPSSTPLQADAEFTYTAPDEADQRATVSLEARSRRGIGKASIDLDTQQRAYQASYSGELTLTGTIASLTQPFTTDITFVGGSGAFAYTPSDERSGSVEVSGSGGGATLTGGGTYTIADSGAGDGTLIMTVQINSCVDVSSICRDSTLPVVLTPV